MKTLIFPLNFVLFSNLSLIAGFVGGKFVFKRDNMNLSSNYSIFISVLLIFYLLSIIIFSLSAILSKDIWNGLILLPYLFVPFYIGKISKYEKINFYTNLQIFTLILSLLAVLLLF